MGAQSVETGEPPVHPDGQAVETGEPPVQPAGQSVEKLEQLERLRRIEAQLGEVRSALSRLDDGSYGRCAACGAEIDDGVLSSDPLATLCGACGQPRS